MKKQLIAGVIGIMLMSAAALPAYADNPKDSDTMKVTYTQTSTWVVSIPETSLSATEETKQCVTATSINIEPGNKLQVKITGIDGGEVTLKRSQDNETTICFVSTKPENAKPINGDTVIAEFENQSTKFANGTTGELYFSKIAAGTKAGNYTGSITYTMSTIKEQP